MRTSRFLVVGTFAALAACDFEPVSRSVPTTNTVTLPDGLVISGARGWCVDAATTRSVDASTVVIFGSCAALSQDAAQPRPSVSGIVSISVENSSASALPFDVVETFLLSDAGHAALARDGTAESVEILETDVRGDMLVVHAIDRSGVPSSAAEEYWRALFDLDGRAVTVSLVAASNARAPDAAWRAALDEQVARLKSANAI